MSEMTATVTLQSALRNENYALLTTFRKSGQAIGTAVWFAQHGDRFYVMTMKDSGKVKRIRNNPHVQLAACNASGVVHGPTVDARARLLSGDAADAADRALNRKYGFQKRMFDIYFSLSGKMKERAFIEIVGE